MNYILSNRFLPILLVALASATMAEAQSTWDNQPDDLVVSINDLSNEDTNIRTGANGKVVDKLELGEKWSFVMYDGVPDQNGWLCIKDGAVYRYDEEAPIEATAGDYKHPLKGSTTGYWVHNSVVEVLAFHSSDDDEPITLHQQPLADSPVVYGCSYNCHFHPLRRQGDWLLVKTLNGKYQGWVNMEHIISGYLYTTPEGERADQNVYMEKHYDLDQSFYVNGQPNIESFVKAINEEDEHYGWYNDPLFDLKNGYFHYGEEGDGGIHLDGALWKRKDGSILFMYSYNVISAFVYDAGMCSSESSSVWHTYKVHNFGRPNTDNEPGYLTDCGIMAWIYDPQTHLLRPMQEPPFKGMPEAKAMRRYQLPQKGYDVEVIDFKVEEDYEKEVRHTLKWNGMEFVY